MTATLTSTDIDNDRCPKCGAPIAGDIVRITRAKFLALTAAAQGHRYESDTVTLPRAQHEALMAAAKALRRVRDDDSGEEDWGPANRALAALRAAGISEGEPND